MESPVLVVPMIRVASCISIFDGIYASSSEVVPEIAPVIECRSDLESIEKYFGEFVPPFLIYQSELDAQFPQYTPLPDLMTELTPLGLVTLGPIVAKTASSVTYRLIDRPDYLIKYSTDCENIINSLITRKPIIHPLITDFWYAKTAHVEGFSVDPYYLSPPGAMCVKQEGKCEFVMPDFSLCRSNRSTLRYMIFPDVGAVPLQMYQRNLAGRVVPFVTAIRITERLLGILQVLHTKHNIMHGHLDLNAVQVVANSDGGVDRILLTNFVGETPNKRWEDIARVIKILARILNDQVLYATIPKAPFGNSGPLFVSGRNYNTTLDPIATLEVTDDVKEQIRGTLRHIMNNVITGYANRLPVIQYQDLLASLHTCSELASMKYASV